MNLSIPGLAAALLALAPAAAAQLSSYSQDFEGLDPMDPAALSADGWGVFANVFDPMGGYLYGYGTFPAPNGGPAFSGVDTGSGGPAQGTQYMNTYSDYNNADHANGNYIEANVFQEQTIGAGNVGETWTFSFDYLKNPVPNNGDGDTTTIAFIKVLQSSNGTFAQLAFETLDTTMASSATWTSDSISLLIDPSFAGELLQVGFSSTATLYNDSSRYYDNVSFDAPGSMPPTLMPYSQDFEALDMMDPAALSDDGWGIFANVFDPMGGFLYGYGVFPAPNGGPGFSAVATGDGGPPQMTQYMSAYSDYNNMDHANGNVINALVFQERTINPADVGSTWRFSFDHRQNPLVNNGAGATTTQAFVKVIQVSNGSFATLFENQFDSTVSSVAAWSSMALDILIDPAYAGEVVQFGFSSFATNYDDSSRLYDNLEWNEIANPGLGSVVCLANPNSTGGSALLTATGSDVAADNNLTLTVVDLPLSSFGIFVTSPGGVVVYNPAGSDGHLCIASTEIGRYNTVINSGTGGTVTMAVDLTAVPTPTMTVPTLAGETRAFQFWSRDTNMAGATSTYSSAVSVTFL